MSRADTGGFDLVLALSPQYLVGLCEQYLPHSLSKTVTFDLQTFLKITVDAHMSLTCTLDLSVTGVTVVPAPQWTLGPTISIDVAANTSWSWDEVRVHGDVIIEAGSWAPAAAGAAPLAVVTASAQLTTSDQELLVNDISVSITIPPGGLEQIPGVTGLLTALRTIPGVGAAAAKDASDWLYGQINDLLNSALHALVPDHTHIATLPSAVTVVFSVAVAQPTDVLVMMALTSGEYNGVPPGLFPVIRSPIRHGADGTAEDALGLVVANYWLFRHGIRPAVAKGLGLDDAHFSQLHPCCWIGTKELTSQLGISLSLTSLLAQIDMTGALIVSGSINGQDSAHGVSITGSFSVGAQLSTDKGRVTVTLLTPRVTLGVDIAAWVWVTAAMTGGSTAVVAVAVTQAIAGGELQGAVSGALASKLPPSLGVNLPDVGVVPVVISTTQPDAEFQVIAGPFSSTMPVSRCNDVILALDVT